MPTSLEKSSWLTPPPLEEVVACPLCNSEEANFLFWNIDRCYKLPGKFGIVECAECGLVRLSPRPSADRIGFYYPEATYYSYQSPGSIRDRGTLNNIRTRIRNTVLSRKFKYPKAVSERMPRFLEAFLATLFYYQGSYGLGEKFPTYVKNGKALDVGCGNGSFLGLLKENGWDVLGADPSAEAARTADENFGIRVVTSQIENWKSEKETFDYIHMSHSIEHLPDPINVLTILSRLLKPTGALYIETPNIGAKSFEVFRECWMPLETPRHLFLFTPDTLKTAVLKAGLEIVKCTTSYKDFDHLSRQYLADRSEQEVVESSGTVSRLADRALSKEYRGEFIHCWARKP